jgi:hypothetical protein
METSIELIGPVPAPWPSPLSGDFMTEAQWAVYFALLDGALPGFTSQSRAAAAQKGDVEERVVLSDDEFERMLDRAGEALPAGAAKSREELAAYLEYRPLGDQGVRQDCLGVLVKSGQREQLAQVLYLLR